MHCSISAVALSSPITLPDAEKLDVLRHLDQFRQWHSVDDKRYCLVCGQIVTGKEIQVTGGTLGIGPLQLSCPTERCNSISMDWVLPTAEILAIAEKMAAEERSSASASAIPRDSKMPRRRVIVRRGDGAIPTRREKQGIALRLRKLVHFWG